MFEQVLFGTNGIRGIVNQDLTPEFVVKIGEAIGTYFDGGELLVGYDGRTSSPVLFCAVSSGLCSTGCRIFDVGYAPTPAIQFAVKHFNADGAVIITASHNPPEYNGIKVVAKDGVEIPREEEVKIEDVFFSGKLSLKTWDKLGKSMKHSGILDVYKAAIKSHVDVEAISKAHLKVVVDPGNSVGVLIAPYIFRELGCEVVTINSQLDGNFPGRLPEPKPETLTELSATVKAIKADLGVAFDGDADRCIFVDETGVVHWGEKTGGIIVDYVLQNHPGSIVVTPVSSSKLIEDIVRKRYAKLVWTRVGSVTVSRKMLETGSIISLEENGGLFYGPHQPVRDGTMASVLILEILAKKNKPLSFLIKDLPRYYLIKKKVDCPNQLKKKVLDKILEETRSYNRITIDGIKLFFENGALLIRPSGTEPIYRIYSEAEKEDRANEIAELGINFIQRALQKIEV